MVVTYAQGPQVVNYINGMVHGGRPNYDFMQEAIETLVYAPEVRRALMIGYGTGELSDVLLRSSEIKEMTIVELNHALMANLRKIPLIRASLADPRIRLIMDDGRRFLIRRPETFDAIVMDPIYHSTVYSNNLYSRQFFQLAARRLSENGVLMVWFSEHRVIPATLASVFPYVRLYDHYGLASFRPMTRNEAREKTLLAQFSRPDQEQIFRSRHYLGDQSLIKEFAKDLPVNEDWKPRCEYYLGLDRKGS